MPLRRSTTISVGASAQNALERSLTQELRLPDADSSPDKNTSFGRVGTRTSLQQNMMRRSSKELLTGIQAESPVQRRASTPVGGNLEMLRRPSTTSNASKNSTAEEESLRRTSIPAWTNPLDFDSAGGDTANGVTPQRHSFKGHDKDPAISAAQATVALGSSPWRIERNDEDGDSKDSRRGSKEKRMTLTESGSPPAFARLDTTVASCLDFLSPVKEGQVAFGLQRKLKNRALHAKVHLLLQDDAYLQEIVSPLLLPKAERNITQLMALRNFMCKTSMFQEIAENPVLQLEVCRCMSLEVFNEKQRIIKENEPGDRAFVLLRGSVAIFRKQFGNHECARMKPVWSFGDIALKVDAPRNASCLAAENGTLVTSLSRKDYRRLLVQSGPRKSALQFYTEYFPTLMTDQQRITLAFVTEVREKLPKGSILTEAGQQGSCFFFIRKGTCNVVCDPTDSPASGGLSQLQRLHGRDPAQQRQQKQKQQVPDAGEKEKSNENEGGDDEEEEKDDDDEKANEAELPKAESPKRGRSGSKGNILGDDLRPPAPPAFAQSWMWQSRSILVTLAPGDFFGMEAAAVEGHGLLKNCYSQTVVAASECEILEVPVSQFQQVFPKAAQRTFASTLLAMSGLRNMRSQFLTNNVPAAVTNYSIPERQAIRSRQSGRAKKFTPVKSEVKYQEWTLPEKDLEMQAIAEESPEARNALMQVRLQERTYKMTSSICLQNCPGDLLKPLVGQPRDLTSMGFRHAGPQQRSPPGLKLVKMQGDRKHHRVLIQDVDAEQWDQTQAQSAQKQSTQQDQARKNNKGDLLQQMRDNKLQRPRSSPQLL